MVLLGSLSRCRCLPGWWPDAAFDGLVQGIVDSACFPYTAANQACNLCPDAQNRLTKITGWHHLTSQADMKTFISTVGPVSACFTVYEDFYYHYTGGVYTYNAATAGKVVGGHCICIVGYDDSQGCWIAKNQWGAGWGESGYFRMSYRSCGLGGWIDAPVVTRNADGRLEVFVIGSDHGLWHMWQTAPNNGWSSWASLGGWIDELSVGQNADGRLEVFARGSDHALWHQWQTAPNNGWSGWASLGGWIDELSVGQLAGVSGGFGRARRTEWVAAVPLQGTEDGLDDGLGVVDWDEVAGVGLGDGRLG